MSYHQDRDRSYNQQSDSRGRGDDRQNDHRGSYGNDRNSGGRGSYNGDRRDSGTFNGRTESRSFNDRNSVNDRRDSSGGFDRRGSGADRRGDDRGFRPYDNNRGGGGGFIRGRGGGGRGNFGGGSRDRPNDFTEVDINDVCPIQVVQPEQLPQEIPAQKDTRVQLNAFSLDLSKAIPVYQYDLTITGIKKRDEKEVELSRHSNNDAARNLKFECLEGIFENLLEKNSTFFQYDPTKVLYVYDRSKTLYSSLKLLEDKEKREFVFTASELKLENKDYIRKYSKIIIILQRTNFVEPSRFTFEANYEEQITIQHYINLLTSQMKMNDFFTFGPKMYRKTSSIPIRDEIQFVLKEGIQKNSRAVANDRGNGVELVLQMDAKKSAFHANIHLVDYVQADSRRDDLRNPSSWRFINKKIKDLCVETTHMERNKKFVIASITKEPANRIYFETNDGEINVVEYFQKQYNIRLNHPDFPCIMESINKKAAAYPIELLKVMDGQRIPHNQMKASLNEKMIRACQQKPVDLAKQIKDEAEAIDLMNSNEFLQLAKIRVIRAGHFTETEAKEVFRPSIVYDQKQLNLKGPTWKLEENKHFLIPSNIQRLAIIGRGSRELDEFVQNYVATANRMGLKIGKHEFIPLDRENGEEVLRLAYDLVRDGFTYLFFVSDSKELHAAIKYSEISENVVTQQIKLKSLRGHDTLKNILMKMNLKAGGRNHTITTDPNLATKIGGSGIDFLRSMLKSTLIIGLEMSLPVNQIKFEIPIKQQEPTCVGYACTVDQDANVISGGYFFQTGRRTVINGALLANRVCDAIKTFNVKNGNYPKQIIIYRSGASEGQFNEIKGEECENLESAIADFCSRVNGEKPKVAVVAIQRKTNHRVFQSERELATRSSNDPPFLQNVTPGTIITKRGTNPHYKEFIMVAQKALLGTAKPIVGTLIYENPAYWSNIDHLANLSHSLCYMHEVCTSPISVPAPLRSAEQLAQRGKNNWVQYRNIDSDTASSSSSSTYKKMTQDEKDLYIGRMAEHFDDLSNILKPKLATKFWA